ncbi:unnamed protein product, partial [Didymodactylos carnosus]
LSRKLSKYGYLFVAPAELNFSNEQDRIRKWQWRYFVLFDDGELTYSVDENPFTLPQERIDLHKCSSVKSSDEYTGHTNSLQIQLNNSKQYFIKSTSKDDIRRWQQLLTQYSPKSTSSILKNSSNRHSTSIVITQNRPSDTLSSPPIIISNNGTKISEQQNKHEKIISHPNETVQLTNTELNRKRDESMKQKKREQYLNNINKFISTTTTTQPRTFSDLTNSQSSERKTKQQIYKERKLNTERSKSLPRVSVTEENPKQSAKKENVNNNNNNNKQTDEKIKNTNGNIIRKGWLSKLEKNQKDWCRYWFILTEDSLLYYQDANVDENQIPAGKFDLMYCKSVEELSTKENNSFIINTNHGQIRLVAVTSGIRKNWIDSLTQCLRQLPNQHQKSPGQARVVSDRPPLSSTDIKKQRTPSKETTVDILRSHLEHIKNDYYQLIEQKSQTAINKTDEEQCCKEVNENN